MRRVFSAFNEEEAFVTGQLSDEQCGIVAAGLRQVVLQVEENRQTRHQALPGRCGPRATS